jgi:hypothetical protein
MAGIFVTVVLELAASGKFVLAATKRAESRADSGNSVEGVNTVPS